MAIPSPLVTLRIAEIMSSNASIDSPKNRLMLPATSSGSCAVCTGRSSTQLSEFAACPFAGAAVKSAQLQSWSDMRCYLYSRSSYTAKSEVFH